MVLFCCASELGLPEDLSAIEVILYYYYIIKLWYSGVASWNMIILTCSRSKSRDKGHTKVNTAGNITISCNTTLCVFSG